MAYKAVVINEGGECFSLISVWAAIPPECAVRYCPHEWTYPKLSGSRLFVWKNLTDALQFVRNCNTNAMALFRCRTKDLKRTRWISAATYSDGHIERFWQNTSGPGYIRPAPNGTYDTKAVMLTEKVERINA